MSQIEMISRSFTVKIASILVLGMGLFCLQARADFRTPASINRGVSAIATPSRIFYGHDGEAISPDLIATFNAIRAQEEKIDASKFIPLDLSPSKDSSMVFSRMADKSMQTMFNSVEFRQSSLGAATIAVQESLKTEVAVKKSKFSSIEHKVRFDVQAFQTLAQLRYSGVTNAAVKYFAASEKLSVELAEKISANNDLILSHSIEPNNRISQVTMQWNF